MMVRANELWVNAIRANEAATLAELRAVLLAGLRKGLSRQVVSEAQLEDFAQDALLKIKSSLERFRGESAFTTWALSLAMRTAFDELRRARWKDVSLDAVLAEHDQHSVDSAASDSRQDRALERARIFTTLGDVMSTELTDKQREVMNAVLALENRGLPFGEIATQLGTNRNALYKLIHDARRKMKAALETRGITLDAIGWVLE